VEETLFMNSKRLLVAGLCTAAVVSLSPAGANAEEKIAPKTLEFLEATTISGYTEASYVYNIKADISNINERNGHTGATGASGSDANHLRAFDNNIGFTLNAIKLVLEKPLGEGDWAAGYRADLLFGQDATQLSRAEGTGSPNFNEASADGFGTYVEQGYVAFRVPVGNGIDFKFGRFVALSGYEVIESPANLNFSRGLLFTWALPLAHNGLLASYRFNDMIDAQLGIVNGWNTWATDTEDPSLIWRIGARNSSGNFSAGLSGYYGRARVTDPAFPGTVVAGTTKLQTAERWLVDGIANFKPTEKVLIGAEALAGNQRATPQTGFGESNFHWWGMAFYSKVQLSDKVSVAGRAEYLNDSDGYLFDDVHASFDPGHNTLGSSNSRFEVWSLTGTLNFDVWKNMLLRFEARYDQASTHDVGSAKTAVGPNQFHPKNDQLTFAVDAIYSF
jgi:hypothetical protein